MALNKPEGPALPKPEALGITIPRHLDAEKFRAGFNHRMAGGNVTEREHLKASFREGFRAACLYQAEQRREMGLKGAEGRMKFTASP